MDETVDGGLRLTEITLVSASMRLTVPPARVQDVQKLLSLEAHGFIPKGRVQYDAREQAFALDLDGAAVSHVLDLLTVAMDTRDSETWNERQARERLQIPLGLDVGDAPTEITG